jgi:hypothetical protein
MFQTFSGSEWHELPPQGLYRHHEDQICQYINVLLFARTAVADFVGQHDSLVSKKRKSEGGNKFPASNCEPRLAVLVGNRYLYFFK